MSQCDYGDEISDYLMHSNMPAVRGVTAAELDSVSIATGMHIHLHVILIICIQPLPFS
jgi:hypothetical protein